MISVKISGTGTGKCALSSRDSDGLTVAFDNDMPLFLGWKSFKQLLSLRLAQSGNPVQLASSATSRANTASSEVK